LDTKNHTPPFFFHRFSITTPLFPYPHMGSFPAVQNIKSALFVEGNTFTFNDILREHICTLSLIESVSIWGKWPLKNGIRKSGQQRRSFQQVLITRQP
jgi:hypothetical protein